MSSEHPVACVSVILLGLATQSVQSIYLFMGFILVNTLLAVLLASVATWVSTALVHSKLDDTPTDC